MSLVAGRGKHFASLLQKGYGVRSGSALVGRDHFLGQLNGPSTTDNACLNTNCVMAGVLMPYNVGSSVRSFNSRTRKYARAIGRKNPGRKSTPTMAIAKSMPLSVREMDNTELITLGAMGNPEARREILKRHIMDVDQCSYDTACETFEAIALKNREGMWLLSLPYKIGIGVAMTAALSSFPLVFDLSTVGWFNEHFVTADVPEPKDLETPLEVGSWAWNWMEPPLGQISFVLLCMQYIRAQIANIGIHPYTTKIMTMRAEKLAKAFPQYNAKVIMDFSESVTFYGSKYGIESYVK